NRNRARWGHLPHCGRPRCSDRRDPRLGCPGLTRLPPEQRGELEMRSPHELIDRYHPLEVEAAADQSGGVARESRRVAGDGDDGWERRGGECRGLPCGAGARRIKYRASVDGKRLGQQRVTCKVAPLDRYVGVADRGAGDRGRSALISLDSMYRPTRG